MIYVGVPVAFNLHPSVFSWHVRASGSCPPFVSALTLNLAMNHVACLAAVSVNSDARLAIVPRVIGSQFWYAVATPFAHVILPLRCGRNRRKPGKDRMAFVLLASSGRCMAPFAG